MGQSSDSSKSDQNRITRIGYPSVEKALAAVRARPSAAESQFEGWTIVEDKANREIWSFTPASHPVHPAVVKRSVIQRGDQIAIQTTALCEATKDVCDRLMSDFEALTKKTVGRERDAAQPVIPADRPQAGGR